MKKAIILIAVVLVVLLPTYILVFQLAKTAPEITMGEQSVDPAFVRWCVINRDGEEIMTSRSLERAKKQFDRADPIILTDVSDLQTLKFSRETEQCRILFYDLSGENVQYDPLTFDQLSTSDITLVGHTQVIMTVSWVISDSIRVEAAYSFEVNA